MTLKIEGMMCEHCERAVKGALEALPFVSEASASHEDGSAVITLSGKLDESAVKQAIEGEDYGYLGIAGEPQQRTVRIEGMMCEHCERAVKGALEALPFVSEASASHESGTALITLSGPLDESAVKHAIEDEGYEFVGIE